MKKKEKKHPLKKLCIYDHFTESQHGIDDINLVDVFDLQKVTFRLNDFCSLSEIPFALFVARISYKILKIDEYWDESEQNIQEQISMGYDLNRVHVSVNGLRLDGQENESEIVELYLNNYWK